VRDGADFWDRLKAELQNLNSGERSFLLGLVEPPKGGTTER